MWAFVGGSVGAYFDGGNTCATRISYGLNESGWAIPVHDNRGSYHNDPKHRFNGKTGDNKKYIVRVVAADMADEAHGQARHPPQEGR